MSEIIKEIIDIIISNEGDEILYLLVFNTLTNKNANKNYSNNSNGIFFNMNNITEHTIDMLKRRINSYLDIKDNINTNEQDRNEIIKTMKDTLINKNNSIKTKEELEEYISNPNKIFSTSIESNLDTPGNSNSNVTKKTRENKEPKRRQVKINKKPVFKGSRKRIDAILRSSTRGQRNNNLFTEENETLDDYIKVDMIDDLEDIEIIDKMNNLEILDNEEVSDDNDTDNIQDDDLLENNDDQELSDTDLFGEESDQYENINQKIEFLI